MAPVYLQDLLDLYRPCRSLRPGNMQFLNTQSFNLIVWVQGIFYMCPQLWNALPFHERMLEIGPKILRFYFFKAIFNYFINVKRLWPFKE